jgi:predicted nuclease of predicted toxin-antitoxin system
VIRFLVDAQLPPGLVHLLIDAGYEAEHVEDAELRHASDSEIWEYAMIKQAVIVTKDEDFVVRHRRHLIGPVIVWLRVGNAANATLLAWFQPILPAIVARIRAGDRLIELR